MSYANGIFQAFAEEKSFISLLKSSECKLSHLIALSTVSVPYSSMQVAFQTFQLREWAFSRTVTDHHAKVNSQIHKSVGPLTLARSALPLIWPCLVQAEGLNALRLQNSIQVFLLSYCLYVLPRGKKTSESFHVYFCVYHYCKRKQDNYTLRRHHSPKNPDSS